MVETNQRYISKELTHFVGAKLSKSTTNYKAQQYKLLVKILNSGLLTHSSPMEVGMIISGNADISENEMYTPFMVCFCDIPIGDLSIHINKFSRFGLSFNKDFIANQGGKPVYYIPKSGSHPYIQENKSNSAYFDDMVKHFRNVFDILLGEISQRHYSYDYQLPPLSPHDPDSPNNLNILLQDFPSVIIELRKFFDYNLFSYIKFFDHNLDDKHRDNFYFEREWRVIGRVEFDIEDVKRILLPREYAKQFRRDCPDYYGQITFVE